LQDWDLILRYTQDSPPAALPVLGGRYHAGRSDSITKRESDCLNYATIRRKNQPRINAPLKVLYALWQYPHLTETSVETELRYMQRRGVEVEVWSEISGSVAPYPTSVAIHHGSLAEAIEQSKPNLVHVHWLTQALQCANTVHAAGLPLTARGHGFEISPDVLAQLEQHPATAAIYLFPHFAGAASPQKQKIRLLPACFNPELYTPGIEKDPRLVVRAGAALPSKDY
jgi:hypothetical protein